MAVSIKTPDQIARMRVAGRQAASVLEMITPYVQPGVSTEKLNQISHDYIVDELKAIPAPLHYKGFPKSICTSVNHVVCHGIPSEKKILRHGDIINIDVTVIQQGMHGDTSKMFVLGNVPARTQQLVHIARESMYRAIRIVKPGVHLGDIGYTIQNLAQKHRFSVVREYCGHGIGENFHEDPSVLHYGKSGTGMALAAGMCFTIEPMLNIGKADTRVLHDQWTVVTKDHSLSAQWEHTILVTDQGYEVLTLRDEEKGQL